MIDKLLVLQTKIRNYNERVGEADLRQPRLSFCEINGLYEITFWGQGYDEEPCVRADDLEDGKNYPFCVLLDFLIDHASQVISLNFTGPDEGANGTKNWDFTRLVNSQAIFENLLRFSVQLTRPEDHNFSIVGREYSEDGMIARLAMKLPKLEELEIPSAPDSSFFELAGLPLRILTVQSGYNHQDFLLNLAKSDAFHDLRALAYTDVMDKNMLGTEDCTPFEHYVALFQAVFLSSCERFHFTLTECSLNDEQLKRLSSMRAIQFLHIHSEPAHYMK